jgi:hypothetical protein
MTWDWKLDPGTRDLVPGIVSGPEEITQRLITRLKRELGEWFLNTSAGLPWYGSGNGLSPARTQGASGGAAPRFADGRGILGAKPHTKRAVDLLIRRETLGTAGVERIIRLNTLFPAGARVYTLYMEVFITGAGVIPISLEGAY